MKRLWLAWTVLIAGAVAAFALALDNRSHRPASGASLPQAVGDGALAITVGYGTSAVFGASLTAASLSTRLSLCEEEIAAHPFASKSARLHMRHKLDNEGEIEDDDLGDRGDMGWAMPDRRYWKTIPVSAQQIPNDLSKLPVVRFTNTEIDGERRIWLKEGPEWDQWLLRDAEHDVWACISVERATKHVFFREMSPTRRQGWRLRKGQDNCYSCHPSGPRVIRPFATESVNTVTLGTFNRRILSYGACSFGDSVDLKLRGKPNGDARCIGCHDGKRRGYLYAVHDRVVHFKTKLEQSMPPTIR